MRTRLYIADISRWGEVGRAYREFLADIRPANSMVEVSALIESDLLVKIEADAIVTQRGRCPISVSLTTDGGGADVRRVDLRGADRCADAKS